MVLFRCLFVCLFLPQFAVAGESLYFGIRHQFEGTRANGMGNAFTAVADDNTAIFYNPAGLSQLSEGESNWYLQFDADPEIFEFANDVSEASDNPPTGQSEEQAIASLLQSKYGDHFSFRLPSIGWLWARPTWGLAVVLADLSMDMGLHRTVGPSINLVAINDTTVALSQLWDIKKMSYGKLVVGVTGKAIYRMEVNKVVSVADLSEDSDPFQPEDAREGFTIDGDVGLLWTSPWESWQLKNGLVIRNILDYGYLAQFSAIGDTSGKPDNLRRAIDLGSALELPGWWIFTNKLALDFRDFLHPNWSLVKSLHLGYELTWDVTSWWRGGWRAGINQGYFTAGFTGEFAWFKLDLATYGEEIGVEGSAIENRRYMMTMSLDF